MKKFLILCLVVMLLSCTKESHHISEVTFGRFCGECWKGNCAPMYKYSMKDKSVALFADTSNHYFDSEAPECTVPITAVEKKKIAEAVIRQISATLLTFDEEEYTFGKPDDHDQCGIYLQITYGDETKTYIIDPGTHDDVPAEVTRFASLVDQKVDELMK